MVREFHKTFGIKDSESPTIPDVKTCDLRLSLIAEEYEELEDEIGKSNIVGVADALADLRYVIEGCALVCGVDLVKVNHDIEICGSPSIPVSRHFRSAIDLIGFVLDDLFVAFEYDEIQGVTKSLSEMRGLVEEISLQCGIDLDACTAEVHRSNMTKLDAGGNVLRREDGKVLKSDLFEPPNLAKVLGIAN